MNLRPGQNQYETVHVLWWYAPFVYIEVQDSRKKTPVCARALVSFDVTNGKWADHSSANRYIFARRGWRTFLVRFTGLSARLIPLYSERS